MSIESEKQSAIRASYDELGNTASSDERGAFMLGWLARAQAGNGVNGWRTIETAPTDGTKIIVGRAGVLWPEDCACYERAYMTITWFRRPFKASDPWCVTPFSTPTHWQPLPEPPKEDGE